MSRAFRESECMSKRIVIILAVLTLHLDWAVPSLAQTTPQNQRPSHIKHDLDKLGFDEKIAITLFDGSKLLGRISGIGDDQFTITIKDGSLKTIAYADTRRITKDFGSTGHQLAFLALSAGALAGLLAFIAVVGRKDSVTR